MNYEMQILRIISYVTIETRIELHFNMQEIVRRPPGKWNDLRYTMKTEKFGWLGFMEYQLCRWFNAKAMFLQIISFISNNSAWHEYTV